MSVETRAGYIHLENNQEFNLQPHQVAEKLQNLGLIQLKFVNNFFASDSYHLCIAFQWEQPEGANKAFQNGIEPRLRTLLPADTIIHSLKLFR